MNRYKITIVFFVIILLASVTLTADDAVLGVIGLSDVTEQSALAFWVPLEDGVSVTGIEWYNNDSSLPFTSIHGVAGETNMPESLVYSTLLGESVGGQSDSWSQFLFSQPVASETSGFYILFKFPQDGEYHFDGLGGGTGIGYLTKSGIVNSWFTGDGETWHAMKATSSFAVRPIYTSNKSGAVLVLGAIDDSITIPNTTMPSMTMTAHASPNPFNPSTNISFNLKHDSFVSLDVYNIRGMKVKTLMNRSAIAGEHVITWDGTTDSGQKLSSGLYFARVTTDNEKAVCRITMIK